MEGAYLAHSVYGFFQNGGGLCWVVRVGTADSGAASRAQAALPAAADSGVETLRAQTLPGVDGQVTVELTENPRGEGRRGRLDDKAARDLDLQRHDHGGRERARGVRGPDAQEGPQQHRDQDQRGVEADQARGHRRARCRTRSARRRRAPTRCRRRRVAVEKVEASDFAGDVAQRRGMGGLAAVDEITMVSIPDLWAIAGNGNGNGDAVKDLQGKLIAHCENAGDRMAILDSPPDLLPQDIMEWRMNEAGYDSKFAALYYPWIEVMNPLDNQPLMIPPSGHMAGVWCRTDATRGVHKAPANEVAMGVNKLGFQVTQAEQGNLNKVGINCIRAFPGRGIRVWGARTLSSDPEWRYINVRRLFNYVSESIMEGTQWSVFEPNDEKLWIQLRVAATLLPHAHVARGGAVRLLAEPGVLRQV